MSSLASKFKGAILGSSIEGIVSFHILRDLSFNVQIYDRQRNIDELCGKCDKAICIFPDASRVLDSLKLAQFEAFKKKLQSHSGISIRNADNKILSELIIKDQNFFVTRKSNLLRLLLGGHIENHPFDVPRINFGSDIVTIDAYGDNSVIDRSNGKLLSSKMKLTFKDQSSENIAFVDFLVASDGSHSFTRRYVSPSSRRLSFNYMGFRTLSGIIPFNKDDYEYVLQNLPHHIVEFNLDDLRITFMRPSIVGENWISFSFTFHDDKKNMYLAQRKIETKLTPEILSLITEKLHPFLTRNEFLKSLIGLIVTKASQENIDIISEHNFLDMESLAYNGRVVFIGSASQALPTTNLNATSKNIIDAWELGNSFKKAWEEIISREITTKNNIEKKSMMKSLFYDCSPLWTIKKKNLSDIQSVFHHYMNSRMNANYISRLISQRTAWLFIKKSSNFRKFCVDWIPLCLRSKIFKNLYKYNV